MDDNTEVHLQHSVVNECALDVASQFVEQDEPTLMQTDAAEHTAPPDVPFDSPAVPHATNEDSLSLRDTEDKRADAKEQDVEQNGDAADVDTIDRLTAIEMLQLLKEYKKREFLYVSHIASLQHELHLRNNASSAPSVSNLTCVPAPFELTPAVYHDLTAVVHNALLDPTVNLELRELRLKLYEQEKELQKTKDELKASTFSAESVMGRRLINKCKALQEENTDIGKILLETHLQPLHIQIGLLQKQLGFFKQQLKILCAANLDIEEDNVKLTRQLQDLTLQYRAVQHERASLLQKIEVMEQEAEAKVYHQDSLGVSAPSAAERRSDSRYHQGSASQRRKHSYDNTPRAVVEESSQHTLRRQSSKSGSPSRRRHHHHRKVSEAVIGSVPKETRGTEGKQSLTTKDSKRVVTGDHKQPARLDERHRRGSQRGSRDPSGERGGTYRSGSERRGGRSPGRY